jgi:3-oxoadipate enol-lactonase
VPTLCVCGSDDGSTPPALMKDFSSRILESEYFEISECGHIPCVEQPAQLARLIDKLSQ